MALAIPPIELRADILFGLTGGFLVSVAQERASRLKQEPIPDFDTRFPGKLESCLATPFQTFGGALLYPSEIEQASILFYLIVKNHPFQNGNKRLGLLISTVYLIIVGLLDDSKPFSKSDDEMYGFAIKVATSKPAEKDETIKYINNFLKELVVQQP